MGTTSNGTKAARTLLEHAKAYFAIASANVLQLQGAKAEMDELLDALESISEKACDIHSRLKANLESAMVVKEALGKVVAAANGESSRERS